MSNNDVEMLQIAYLANQGTTGTIGRNEVATALPISWAK